MSGRPFVAFAGHCLSLKFPRLGGLSARIICQPHRIVACDGVFLVESDSRDQTREMNQRLESELKPLTAASSVTEHIASRLSKIPEESADTATRHGQIQFPIADPYLAAPKK